MPSWAVPPVRRKGFGSLVVLLGHPLTRLERVLGEAAQDGEGPGERPTDARSPKPSEGEKKTPGPESEGLSRGSGDRI
ncbi:hypothetical protein Afil01_68150 [Actinorhabdospora filicis]|uniref:Uncharacterized protein n=1 Tax=Actinorhabdospora filicis TaxID=1785913 RepID=A0A9W6STE6_9ACTN|nr:hypothetical protein Afil01_68150 [Actinorhabdospora filicis]